MNIIYQLLSMLLLMQLVTGCAGTQRQEQEASSDVLASLTQQQTMTLLAMLESYDSHQEAIEAWQTSRNSLERLVELEGDLKLLITQLNSLNRVAEQSSKQSSHESTSASAYGVNTSTEHAATADVDKPLNKTAHNSGLEAGFTIQLTALNALQDVRAYWRQVKRKHAAIFADIAPFFEKVKAANGTDLFRLKAGVFDTEAEAVALCREFTQAGGACFTTNTVKGERLH